ncbi:hypothetical protein K435DRAFT_789733 [Dendrothele bispora CBS 962.96]|uniref:Uncharacterized protein n=1 Tax=Dendrothele bispora (strain CBS 962.96) TaxID=1314807 RepID=A0A4S8MUA7_DENBC|nr:hypothetical protein K435DRAFT_789733 [Dendrothele bispora CBS 962.96]
MTTLAPPTSVQDLLRQGPNSDVLSQYIRFLSALVSSTETVTPEVKSYSDAVYFNYYQLGLSLLFKPVNGYKPKTGLTRSELQDDCLILDSVDIYNIPKPQADEKTRPKKSEVAFSSYPVSPVVLHLVQGVKDKEGKVLSRPTSLEVQRESSGKDFVQVLGEPDRKGGGSGPSSGSIGIWCEWTKDGLLIEFGGVEATGPQAWERGKDAVWKIITVFVSNDQK